MISKTTRGK